MLSPEVLQIVVSSGASLVLILLFVVSAAVLPWKEEELDEVEEALSVVASQARRAASRAVSSPVESALAR